MSYLKSILVGSSFRVGADVKKKTCIVSSGPRNVRSETGRLMAGLSQQTRDILETQSEKR